MQIEPVFEKARHAFTRHCHTHLHKKSISPYLLELFIHTKWTCVFAFARNYGTNCFCNASQIFIFNLCVRMCVRGETQPKKVPFNYFVVRLMLSAITTTTTAAAATTPVVVATLPKRAMKWSLTQWMGSFQPTGWFLFYQRRLCLCLCWGHMWYALTDKNWAFVSSHFLLLSLDCHIRCFCCYCFRKNHKCCQFYRQWTHKWL